MRQKDLNLSDIAIKEFALFISATSERPTAEDWANLVKTLANDWLQSRGLSLIPDNQTLRVYYGNEFCQQRIPGAAELRSICASVHQAGFSLTFATPPVNDQGCEILSERLVKLQDWLPGSEVTVNDWGVLRLLNRSFPSLTPVLGRLMNKFLRDPRITSCPGRLDLPADALSGFQRSSLSISGYRRLLADFGVNHVELDNLYQGIETDFSAMGLGVSLYLPFGYVTIGRICMMGNEHLPPNLKFQATNGHCPQPCRHREIELVDRYVQMDGDMYSFILKGNTVFYRQGEQIVLRGLTWAANQGARIVCQREIPF